jgi:hypothetical protein
MQFVSWDKRFVDPIAVPGRKPLVTLRDAATPPRTSPNCPMAEHDADEWQAAMEALLLVAEQDGPPLFARIGIMRAINRHVERVFDPSRKDKHCGTAEDAPNDEVCFWRRLTNNGRPRETAGLARGQFSGVLIQSRETNLKAGAHAASTEGRSATILANVGDLVTARPISGAAPASRPPGGRAPATHHRRSTVEKGHACLRPSIRFCSSSTSNILPQHLAAVSAPFGEMAQPLVLNLPRNPERTVARAEMIADRPRQPLNSLTSRLNFSGFSMNMKCAPPSFSSKISVFAPLICFPIQT